ncbi:MAG: site-specific DNA-methyltransferase [Myxococcota bacterium]
MGTQLKLALTGGAPLEETHEALRRIVPGAFVEGRLDPERLLALLGIPGHDDDPERFGFTWAGRREAAAGLRRPATGALHPVREESAGFDEAENVVVEGDNLEVLKLLQRAWGGAVKMIFIDPPYNTGNTFIYEDDFRDGVEAYLRQTGQLDAAGRRRSSRVELHGRHHSRWLGMMYPRLVLARQLLRDDGAIFVSIDDREQHHLRLLMDEVFGAENFVAHISWQKRYTRSNNTNNFTSVIDHVLLYQRSEAFQVNLLPRGDDAHEFDNPDDDPRGPWKPTSFLNQVPPERRPNLAYPIRNPNTGEVTHPDRKAWRVNREGFERLQREGRLYWGADGKRPFPHVKTFRSEIRDGLTPINFWAHGYAGHTDRAHAELKELFGRKVFDTPKPSLLIRRMLEHATGPDDLVMDFFAGSGATAQAVLEQNAEDGGRRRFALVQLPEPVDEGDFDDIAQITRERVRRVLARLEERGVASDPGRGFRALRLAPAHAPAWPTDAAVEDAEVLAALLEERADGASGDAPEEDLLFEVMLRAGHPPSAQLERVDAGGRRTWAVSGGSLLVCLAADLDDAFFEAAAARRPRTVVCREAAFGGDDALRVRAARALEAEGAELRTV